MNFSFADRLTELNDARERSLITDEEYSMLRGRLFESFITGPPTSSIPVPQPLQQQYFSPPLSPQQLSSSPQPSSSPQQFSLPPPQQVSSHQQFSLPSQQQFSLPSHQNSAPVNINHNHQNLNSHSAQASSSSSSSSSLLSPSSVSITHSNKSTSAPPLSQTSPSFLPRRIKSSNNNANDNPLPSELRSNFVSSLFNVVSPRKSHSNNVLPSFPTQTNNNNKHHKNRNTHPFNDNAETTSNNVEMNAISNEIHNINEELQPLSISETRELPEITENQYSSSAPSASIPIATTSSSNLTFGDSLNITQSPPRRSLTTTRPSSMICTNSEHVTFEISRSNGGVGENDVNGNQLPPSSPRQSHVNAATLFRRHTRALSWGFNTSILPFSNNSSNQNNGSQSGNDSSEGTTNDRNVHNNSANNVNNETANANSGAILRNPENNYVLSETDQFEQLVPEVPPPPYTPPESSQTRGRRRPSAFFIKPKTSAELRKELQKLVEQSKKEANSLKIEEARLKMRLNSKPEELDRVKRKIRESNEKYRKKIEMVNDKLRQISARECNGNGDGGNEN